MILGIFWLVLGNAAALLGAHALLRRIGTGRFHLDVVLFFLLRIALISAAVLVAGMLRFLTPAGLGAAATLALVILLCRGEHRQIRIPPLPAIGLFSGILAALLIARLLAQVWFFAPYSGDVLSYHLPKIAEWVRAGGFTREMGVDSHVTFPAGFELVETWWVVFLHHDVLIEMAGLEFLALACAAAYALARQSGLDSAASFFAALIYSLTPVLQFQTTGCLNDGPANSLLLAAAAFIQGSVRIPLILLAAGIGAGIKPIFAYALPGLLLLYLLIPRPKESRPRNVHAMVTGALGLGVGAYWYLRNLFWFGSPIYPVGPDAKLHPNSIQYGPSFRSLGRTLVDLVDVRIYDTAMPYGPVTNNTAGWGLLAFAIGAPCLVAMLRAEPRVRRLAAAFAVSLLSILLFVQFDPWSLRFVAFFPALLAVAAAWAASRLPAVSALAGTALVLQFVATALPGEIPLPLFRELSSIPCKDRSMSVIYGINVPADSVGYLVDNRNKAYLLYRPDFSRRVVYLRVGSSSELRYQMDREGLDVVYASCVSLEGSRTLKESQREGLIESLDGGVFARPSSR